MDTLAYLCQIYVCAVISHIGHSSATPPVWRLVNGIQGFLVILVIVFCCTTLMLRAFANCSGPMKISFGPMAIGPLRYLSLPRFVEYNEFMEAQEENRLADCGEECADVKRHQETCIILCADGKEWG